MPNPALSDIRAATIKDSGDLAAIRAQCFDSLWDVDSFSEMLSKPETVCLIIPNIAYALARKIAPEAELITIAVAPEFRRRGIAENMLHELWRQLQTGGITALHLEVNHKLAAARGLYMKLGFIGVGRRKDYYSDPTGIRHDAILMRLQTPL